MTRNSLRSRCRCNRPEGPSITAIVFADFMELLLVSMLVVALHLWRRNATLSTFGGTAVYVGIASVLAAAGW